MHPAGKASDGHVTQVNEGVAVPLDWDLVEILDLQCGRIRQDEPVGRLDLDIPARQYQILPGHGLVNIRRGEVARKEFLLIKIDHDLHILAPVGMRQDRAGNCDQERADSHDGKVIEFRRGQRLRRDLQGGYRHLRGKQPHDHGCVDIRR